MKKRLVPLSLALSVCSALCATQPAVGRQQPARQAAGANVKVYRGSLSDRGIEVRLARGGGRVSGSYAYDGIGQSLKLEGRETTGEKFELTETDAAGRQTGKWSCEGERQGEWDQDLNCKWTRPDGKNELFVALYEQASFASRLRVAPKTVVDRRFGVHASYPQLAAAEGAQLSPAAQHFNRLLEEKVGKEARGFGQSVEPQKNLYFDANYNVLAATDDFISVELSYDSFAGGAHPNSAYDTVNYDLRADRELKTEDILRPGYEKVIAAYCFKDIARRADAQEQEDAKREGRKPNPPSADEPPVPAEELETVGAVSVTPRGLLIYYDLPHVVAVFDRNFVPYSIIKDKLRPGTPAARFAR
jgi:hypothetical protein